MINFKKLLIFGIIATGSVKLEAAQAGPEENTPPAAQADLSNSIRILSYNVNNGQTNQDPNRFYNSSDPTNELYQPKQPTKNTKYLTVAGALRRALNQDKPNQKPTIIALQELPEAFHPYFTNMLERLGYAFAKKAQKSELSWLLTYYDPQILELKNNDLDLIDNDIISCDFSQEPTDLNLLSACDDLASQRRNCKAIRHVSIDPHTGLPVEILAKDFMTMAKNETSSPNKSPSKKTNSPKKSIASTVPNAFPVTKFQIKATGQEFIVANVHLSLNHTVPDKAFLRKDQLQTILWRLHYQQKPIILVGDTNSSPEALRRILTDAINPEFPFKPIYGKPETHKELENLDHAIISSDTIQGRSLPCEVHRTIMTQNHKGKFVISNLEQSSDHVYLIFEFNIRPKAKDLPNVSLCEHIPATPSSRPSATAALLRQLNSAKACAPKFLPSKF